MSNKEYIELLKTARANARRQYVLARTLQEKQEWLQHSSNLLEKLYVAKMEIQNEDNRKSSN